MAVEYVNPSITQALHLYAGDTYTTKITQQGGRLDQLLQKGESDGPIIQELYLAALSRLPDESEQRALTAALGQTEESKRKQALADLTWALLSSREFSHNH